MIFYFFEIPIFLAWGNRFWIVNIFFILLLGIGTKLFDYDIHGLILSYLDNRYWIIIYNGYLSTRKFSD